MTRINIINDGAGAKPVASKNPGGRGALGDIRESGFFGRNITVKIGDQERQFNRGSLIEFINANQALAGLKAKLDKGSTFWRKWTDFMHFEQGSSDEAINEALGKLIPKLAQVSEETLRDSDRSWLSFQGETDVSGEHYEAAIQHLEKEEDADSLYSLARVYSRQKNNEQAITILEKAKNLYPTHDGVRNLLKVVYKSAADSLMDAIEKGQEKDKVAFSYYEKGYALRSAACTRGLAQCYFDGRGVEQDSMKAKELNDEADTM